MFRDFVGAPLAATWYHSALADARFGADLRPGFADIAANFNVNLGNPGCLTGVPFYLGLDNNHGPAIDLVTVLLHEFGHGLGFSTTTNGTTGAQLGNAAGAFPSAYDHFLYDNTQNLVWTAMTPAQRVASAINSRRLAWTGANVTAGVPVVLQPGTAELTGTAPASVAGTYLVGTASFGPPLTPGGLSGELMPVVDQANGTGLACTAFNTANALAVNGKVALIDRGVCGFPDKVKNAQNAGAVGVIIVDNVAGSPPPGLGRRRSDDRHPHGPHHAGGWGDVQISAALPLAHQVGGAGDDGVEHGDLRRGRRLGTRPGLHAQPLPGRVVGLALGHHRDAELAHGARDQRRPDALGGNASGPDVRHA